MGRFLKQFLIYILVTYFVLNICKGIGLPENPMYLFTVFFVFPITVFLSSALLNFLTVKENLITLFLMTSILTFGVFFLIEAFLPGFVIEAYTFQGLDTGSLVINEFEVTVMITMLAGSLTYSFITSILNVLEKSA